METPASTTSSGEVFQQQKLLIIIPQKDRTLWRLLVSAVGKSLCSVIMKCGIEWAVDIFVEGSYDGDE